MNVWNVCLGWIGGLFFWWVLGFLLVVLCLVWIYFCFVLLNWFGWLIVLFWEWLWSNGWCLGGWLLLGCCVWFVCGIVEWLSWMNWGCCWSGLWWNGFCWCDVCFFDCWIVLVLICCWVFEGLFLLGVWCCLLYWLVVLFCWWKLVWSFVCWFVLWFVLYVRCLLCCWECFWWCCVWWLVYVCRLLYGRWYWFFRYVLCLLGVWDCVLNWGLVIGLLKVICVWFDVLVFDGCCRGCICCVWIGLVC